ncbi:NAD(P)-binding protein [Zopfia rhizophila CBS 207.26]|uniref:NAD(P)-binding protein n=1 Tax=Zopfia rhizophila CBS 207.26 TaxID=1314779 RepID=A0A6A6EI95_9PEZI|nr:NAD(P)-binding protein [Zopfia rhizophila CBS 207.26]
MIRHALITGGSRGIGLAIARLLAKNSYRITLVSRTESHLQSALSTLPDPISPGTNSSRPTSPHSDSASVTPSPHKYVVGSVTSGMFWNKHILGSSLRHEVVDVMVNCAGIGQNSLLVRTTVEDIDKIVDTNLTSMLHGIRYLVKKRHIRRSDFGDRGKVGREAEFTPCIINIASLLGVKGGRGAVAYVASKAGVLGLTRALAAELGPQSIRVNAIVPGYIETDMTADIERTSLLSKIPLRRFGTPDEIAQAALFLATNQYANNCVINLDGGLSAT